MNIMWTADIRMKWRCDHRSCGHRKVSPKNVFGASTGFELMASALALQCSTNRSRAMKTHTLGARMSTINSINWPWVRIPLKPWEHFWGLLCDCLNRNHNCDDHIFNSLVVVFDTKRRTTRFKVRKALSNKFPCVFITCKVYRNWMPIKFATSIIVRRENRSWSEGLRKPL